MLINVQLDVSYPAIRIQYVTHNKDEMKRRDKFVKTTRRMAFASFLFHSLSYGEFQWNDNGHCTSDDWKQTADTHSSLFSSFYN